MGSTVVTSEHNVEAGSRSAESMFSPGDVRAGVQRAGRRVVGVVQVRQSGRRRRQRLVERVTLLDQDPGHLDQPLDVAGERVLVLPDETGDLLHRHAEVAQRGGEVLTLLLQHPRRRGDAVVEVAHGLVVVGEHLDELVDLVGGVEQRVLVVVQRAGEPAQVADGLVELLALTAEVVGRGLEQPRERAVAVGSLRPEPLGEVADRLVDVVELERDRGLVGAELGAVLHHRARLVDRGELDEAVADHRRSDHDGLGVRRDLVVRVVLHRHLDGGAGRAHLDHLTDPDAEDAHVGALVDRDGAREVGLEDLRVL